jgi:hypothetical protein
MRPWFPLLLAPIALWLACSGEPPANGEGEGESSEGEGEATEGEGEAPLGEGEGENNDCGCPDGQACGSIFGGDSIADACFARCESAGACTLATGGEGECLNMPDFSSPVCRTDASNLQRCGNAVNSGCVDDEAYCVQFNDDQWFPTSDGVCVVGCGGDGECADGQGCALDLVFLGDGAELGVCAPSLTTVGAPCGLIDDVLTMCTGALTCSRANGETVGTCIARP